MKAQINAALVLLIFLYSVEWYDGTLFNGWPVDEVLVFVFGWSFLGSAFVLCLSQKIAERFILPRLK